MRCPSFLEAPLLLCLLAIFLLGRDDVGDTCFCRGGPSSNSYLWGGPQRLAAASGARCGQQTPTFLRLLAPPGCHGPCHPLRTGPPCRPVGPFICFRGAPMCASGGGPRNADATLISSAISTVREASGTLGSCTQQGPCRVAEAHGFGASREWLSLVRYLRAAPTSECRIRRLMQLALEGPATRGVPRDLQGNWHFALQREEGPWATTEGAAEVSAMADVEVPTNSLPAREAGGFLLVGPRRPVEGCAASASVSVRLLLPEGPYSGSTSSSSNLCCTAAARGVKIYVQGTSDSLVVGGLLQLLFRGPNGGPPCNVWALKAMGVSRLLHRSGLLGLIPETRIRGLRGALEALTVSTQDLLLQLFSAEGGPAQLPQGFVAEGSPTQTSHLCHTKPAPAPAAASAEARDGEETPRRARERGEAGLEFPRHPGLPHLPSVGPPGSLLLGDAETAAWAETSRLSLPTVGGAGAEVYVLLSGGVDSSVSLLLLREWGFRPKPVFLKVWAPEAAQLRQQQEQQQGALAAAAAAAASCPWEKDVEAAKAAAVAAGLPLEVLPMQQQYWERVIAGFLEGARKGLTLNPDWSCNSAVKFGAFAEALGDSQAALASGHYARVREGESPKGTFRLFRGVDGLKDQSYFLSGLAPGQLSRLLLPLGPLLKTQVRQLALRWGLPSARRPDSQGLCFLGPLAVGPFLMHLLGEQEGPVLHFPSGVPVGSHKGLWGFTAGQQKGVVPLLDPRLCRRCTGASGRPPTLSGPWSVVGKAPEAKALFVVSREDEAAAEARVRALVAEPQGSRKNLRIPLLAAAERGDPAALLAIKLRQLRTQLRVDKIHWIGGAPPPEFAASTGREGLLQHPPAAADAAAAAAIGAAQRGAAILSGKPARTATSGLPHGDRELVVQVRHSAAFDGIAKHRFQILWTSAETPGAPWITAAAELLLEEPDVGLAPGQVAAFYRGDECLGSGHISASQGFSLMQEALGRPR